MNNNITRRDWLNKSAAVLGSSFVGAIAGFNPLLGNTKVSTVVNTPIRMMFNENPYGPSQVARKAMRKAFSESNLYSMRYAKAEFKILMAKLNGVTPDYIAVGFGSGEILKKAALMNGIDKGELISPALTFETINRFAKTMKSNVKRIPMDNKIGIDLDRTAESVGSRTKLIYLCNPNNPTGSIMGTDQLESFCKTMSKKSIVFVDEAYHEYVTDPNYRSMIDLVKKGHNVIVSRTASKVHGLAGLRVGFAITTPEIAKRLESYLTDSLNVIGLRAAIASYQDERFQAHSIEQNNRAKKIVTNHLDNKGIEYLDSQTNFIFIKTGMNIEEFQPAMEKNGVIVGRPFPPYNKWCRLSMAKPEEMENFNTGMDRVLG
ncbi:MAG: aminotransferase class I/II-fold pyridoxal phosphate-dependent enzyme [Candidatus Marinimicrobia bacterium]|nr:aminotransferase class I/II-fold pyridoxal phosphate-dependent enzyme [Candidatus Neomarinimicrobiota bacterium]MBT4785256.1 aminotransferase class I/II-fold pyridoxal phosphate-dependent enzyme [Candidatus Neomarinimicrobiota bacterium]MBT5439720.1 aminotransferase class I/II-fold pyridoxal phosphate-dependent enzyme [Candidatus Neomarinimicrobiota bacterium]